MDAFGFPNKQQDYPEAQTLVPSVMSSAAPIVYWNLNLQQNAEITLTQNVVFAAPVGWKKGRLVMLEIIQGGVGSYTPAWNTMFVNMASLTLNTTVGYSNILVFKCIEVNGAAKVQLISNVSSTRA